MKRHVKDLINKRGLQNFATVRPDSSISDALVDDKENQIRELTTYVTGSSAVFEFDQEKTNYSKIPIYSSEPSKEVV